jgi:DNA polymerase-3 subunit alpha
MSHGFVHLRVKSSYSIAASMLRPAQIADWAKAAAMPAFGVCDAASLYGAIDLSESLAKVGVQPLIGCELPVAFAVDPHTDVRAPLVVLPKSKAGWANLMWLASEAYLHAGLDGPVVGMADLLAHAEDLILLTGGPKGRVAQLLRAGRAEAAAELLDRLCRAFGDRVYVELIRDPRGRDAQAAEVEAGLASLAYDRGLGLVASQDARCRDGSQLAALDALFCISEGRVLSHTDRQTAGPADVLMSGAEMTALFADVPEALSTTLEVARRCAFRPTGHAPILPAFPTTDGRDEAAELRAQAEAGLAERLRVAPELYGTRETYAERLGFELSVIGKMGFDGYFLIVSDFIRWAKARDIPVGPGRGSGAGSLVAWALSITDLDPLRFGLLFERFLNPERVSMPDFDIDFCQDRRGEVIEYVRDRYGADRVAHIITFGTLQARAVLRDVGRVMSLPYGQVDKLAKLVPFNPAAPITLEKALEVEPRLKEARADADVDTLISTAISLEGLYRNASTHAAGVVIGDRPLVELTPLYKDRRSELPATQYNMKWAEVAGLVKFDFLGLKTLTVIQKAIRFLTAEGEALTPAWERLDDPSAYQLMASGDTLGVFQLESTGMRDTLRKVRPDKIEDVIALISLYRPGPMKNIDTYVAVKFGRQKPDYLHPSLEGILKETYGIIVYQEQVMQIAQILAGYSLGEADMLRRAMGKKKKEEMDKQREIFVSRASGRGVEPSQATHIFDLVAEFAGYGFNKSHAAAYAVIAYQTAYLKARHPAAFIAASMSLDIDNTDKLAAFVQEAQRLRVPVVAPDVCRSEADFGVAGGKVLYALGALKGVGVQAMAGLVTAREAGGGFADLHDVAARVDPRTVNRRVFEALARAGAFDSLAKNRAAVFRSAEALAAGSQAAHADREAGQVALFGDDTAARVRLAGGPDWSAAERLAEEFAAVGFYLSGHPLDDIFNGPARQGLVFAADLQAAGRRLGGFDMVGILRTRQERPAKSGGKFAYCAFSDPTGLYELFVPPELLEAMRAELEVGQAFKVRVRATRREEEVRFAADGLEVLSRARLAVPDGLTVRVAPEADLVSLRHGIGSLAPESEEAPRGSLGEIWLEVAVEAGQTASLRLPGRYRVDYHAIARLRTVPGVAGVAARMAA